MSSSTDHDFPLFTTFLLSCLLSTCHSIQVTWHPRFRLCNAPPFVSHCSVVISACTLRLCFKGGGWGELSEADTPPTQLQREPRALLTMRFPDQHALRLEWGEEEEEEELAMNAGSERARARAPRRCRTFPNWERERESWRAAEHTGSGWMYNHGNSSSSIRSTRSWDINIASVRPSANRPIFTPFKDRSWSRTLCGHHTTSLLRWGCLFLCDTLVLLSLFFLLSLQDASCLDVQGTCFIIKTKGDVMEYICISLKVKAVLLRW